MAAGLKFGYVVLVNALSMQKLKYIDRYIVDIVVANINKLSTT